MFWTMNTVPSKVFSWKFWNCWRNSATLKVKPRAEYFAPISNAFTFSGSNCRLPTSACAPPRAAKLVVSVPLAIGCSGAFSADRSKLKPPAL